MLQSFHIGLRLHKKVLLVQPSSAASERVFSLLKASFNEQQQYPTTLLRIIPYAAVQLELHMHTLS